MWLLVGVLMRYNQDRVRFDLKRYGLNERTGCIALFPLS
jgi:hypothetical protein